MALYTAYSGLRLRLIDFDEQPWDEDLNASLRAIGDWYDSTAAPSLLGWKNAITNGAMRLWRRGTTFTPTHGVNTPLLDRWVNYMNGAGSTTTISRQTSTDAILLQAGCPYYAKYAVSVAGSDTVRQFKQVIPGVSTFSGSQVTLSFVAWGTAGKQLGIFLAQSFGTGGSPSATVNSSTQIATLTATPTLYTMTFTLADVTSKTLGTNGNDGIVVVFSMPLTQTFECNIGRVCFEKGSVYSGLPFLPLGAELAECMRFYQSSFDGSPGAFALDTAAGQQFSHPTANFRHTILFPTPFHLTPTLSVYDHLGNINAVSYYTGSWNSGGLLTSSAVSKKLALLRHGIGSSIETAFGWRAEGELFA